MIGLYIYIDRLIFEKMVVRFGDVIYCVVFFILVGSIDIRFFVVLVFNFIIARVIVTCVV